MPPIPTPTETQFRTLTFSMPQQFVPSIRLGTAHVLDDGEWWVISDVDIYSPLSSKWATVTVHYMQSVDTPWMQARIDESEE